MVRDILNYAHHVFRWNRCAFSKKTWISVVSQQKH